MATGLTLSSTSNLSTGQRILVREAKLAFEPAAPEPDLVDSFDLPAGHKQAEIGTYARLSTASALTEGVDLSEIQQLVANYLTITPTEHGVIATLSKRAVARQGDTNLIASTGRMLANSLRLRMAGDIDTLYDGFSKSTPGASLTLDITYIRGIVAYLLTDNDSSYGPAPMPVNGALHPEQISDIVLDLSDPGTAAAVRSVAGMPGALLERWWRGSDRVYGVAFYTAAALTRDSANDAKGAVHAKEALALVRHGDTDPTEEPDNSLRVTEYGIFQAWGEGERADSHGVEVYSDAAATI